MALPAVVPVLVYDGDCAFCTSSARVLATRLRRSPADFAIEPWQHLDMDRVAAGVYAWVAANRHRLPGGSAACSV